MHRSISVIALLLTGLILPVLAATFEGFSSASITLGFPVLVESSYQTNNPRFGSFALAYILVPLLLGYFAGKISIRNDKK
jgi:hypothetical protein